LFHADGQADMTKLIVAFRNFGNAPKNRTIFSDRHSNSSNTRMEEYEDSYYVNNVNAEITKSLHAQTASCALHNTQYSGELLCAFSQFRDCNKVPTRPKL
jgi:hypothetical protein